MTVEAEDPGPDQDGRDDGDDEIVPASVAQWPHGPEGPPFFTIFVRARARLRSGKVVDCADTVTFCLPCPPEIAYVATLDPRDGIGPAYLYGGADGLYDARSHPDGEPDLGLPNGLARLLLTGFPEEMARFWGPVPGYLSIHDVMAGGLPYLDELADVEGGVEATDLRHVARLASGEIRRRFAWTGTRLAFRTSEPHWNVLVHDNGRVRLSCEDDYPVDRRGRWTAGASFRLDDGARAAAVAQAMAAASPRGRLVRDGTAAVASGRGLREDVGTLVAYARQDLLRQGLDAVAHLVPEGAVARIRAFQALPVAAEDDAPGAGAWWAGWDALWAEIGPALAGGGRPRRLIRLQAEMLAHVDRTPPRIRDPGEPPPADPFLPYAPEPDPPSGDRFAPLRNMAFADLVRAFPPETRATFVSMGPDRLLLALDRDGERGYLALFLGTAEAGAAAAERVFAAEETLGAVIAAVPPRAMHEIETGSGSVRSAIEGRAKPCAVLLHGRVPASAAEAARCAADFLGP